MRLILFDIDGTLIRDDGAAREAYAKALREVYDFPGSLHRYDFSGRTDLQITYEVLRHAGYSEDDIEEKIGRLWSVYVEELRRLVSAVRIRILPGVQDLLERLASETHVTLGLLTGNIEPGARVKLEPHHLNRYFPFGAFGSDSREREDLPPIAVERARRLHGHRFEGRDVVVIGDSIYDVRCGVPHQATTIAVPTGVTPAEKLRAENPDYFFDSLEPTEELLAAVRGK
jgi:phosphoglycolate phosphatase